MQKVGIKMSKENVHLLKVKLEGRVLKSKMENEASSRSFGPQVVFVVVNSPMLEYNREAWGAPSVMRLP